MVDCHWLLVGGAHPTGGCVKLKEIRRLKINEQGSGAECLL